MAVRHSVRDSESRVPRIPSVCCCTGVKVHAGYRQKWTVRMDICGRTDECQKSLTWSMAWIYEGTEFFFLSFEFLTLQNIYIYI